MIAKKFNVIPAAWVHRGFSDDVTEVNIVPRGADLITDFQKDKFRHFFFHVLDLNSDCVISAEDFDKLNEASLINIFLLQMFFSYSGIFLENPSLYGLVSEQHSIFSIERGSWHIFGMFPQFGQ